MCYYVQKLHWFCTSIFTDYSLWLRNEIKHELSLLNSQQRTPNKRLHCIAELRSRAQSMGIADFCRFSSGCSILIKSSEQWPNFSAARSQFLQQFLFLFVLRSRLKKLFASNTLPLKKKRWGGLPAFRISMCPSKNLPPFLFPDQTFTNLFPVFERWGQNHQFFVDTCGLNALFFCFFFWFSCSCVRGRSNFSFSTRTSFYIQLFQYSYLISIGNVK